METILLVFYKQYKSELIMSFPEIIKLELKVAKKNLRFGLGDLVVPVEPPTTKPYCVAGFLPTGSREDHADDYVLKRISKRGKPVSDTFREKELKPYER
mgnify:CR=1 FL=1